MIQHTSGPWIEKYRDGQVSIKGTDGHGQIAVVSLRKSKNNNVEELSANAQLIAAAPKLLEACQAIARLSNEEGRKNLLMVAGMAKLAISKAIKD